MRPNDAAVPLIPRRALFGNPDRMAPAISPDGKRLAFIAPSGGVLNVWVCPAENPGAATPVTRDVGRGVRSFAWAHTCEHLLYPQDNDGDENWHIHVVSLAMGETKDLTSIAGVSARVQHTSRKFPGEILLAINDRDARFHDIYRVDIVSGDRSLAQENPGFAGFVTDDDFNVRLATRQTDDGGDELLKPGEGGWKPFIKVALDDVMTTGPVGFDGTGRVLFMRDSRGRDTAALVALALETGEKTTLAEDAKSDVGAVLRHPTDRRVQAVNFNYERERWLVLDPSIAGDFDYLQGAQRGDLDVVSRTLDDLLWVVAYSVDDGPVRYYLYDRRSKEQAFLFCSRSALDRLPLAQMKPVVIRSRDGLDLVSYLTLPSGAGPRPQPMVLVVHGGPWGRDSWGFNATHQWLANRGYVVISVNYRGSTGFGKGFINAGNREWAGKMHDDLVDGVQWAIESGIADPKRIAIFGGSYGGYAALVGLTFTPDLFACGVDLVGPSNLITLLNSVPPYWLPMIENFTRRVGDHRTEEGRLLLAQRSPLTFADRIARPLLIGHGANDPRVKKAEADQIASAMRERGVPVTYLLYSDEGHGFARPENRMSFNAAAEAFLAARLGGRCEPIGDEFRGSSASALMGVEHVPGLSDALEAGGRA